MKTDINLTTQAPREKKTIFRLTAMMGAVFFLMLVVSVFLIIYSFILDADVSALSKQESSLKSQISSFARQKETLSVTNERLTNIKKIISSRKTIDIKMAAIMTSVPPNFGFENVTVEEDEISLIITSASLSDFDSFLEERLPILTKDKSLGIKYAELSSFSQFQDNYRLSLVLSFVNKVNKK